MSGPELQIKGGIKDKSEIIFLISQDGSNDGLQHTF